jgi:RecA/RadA recombinase
MGLDELKTKINRNVKGAHADILSKSDIAKINEWVSTPHFDLNRVLSGSLFGGIPEKSMVALVGPEASFKSSFMCLAMANAQTMGYTPVIIDTEGA